MTNPSRLERHVALMRGVNVGGKNRLPMKDLVALFEGAGCSEVSTYIQSGNVVFSAEPDVARALPAVVAAAIARDFGFDTPVVLRSAGEMARVPVANPFPDADPEAEHLHVMFLADWPDRAAVAALDPARSPPDTFAVVGRDVYLRLPAGIGQSKLTNAWLDRALSTVSTARNWRTVLALIERSAA